MKSPNYSQTEREAAVAAYVCKGTFTGAERITGIPAATLRAWKHRDPAWWEEVTERIRRDYAAEHEAIIRDTMFVSLEQLNDRVQNGDPVLDKEGNLIRVPVKARDLVIAAGTMFDKLRVILGQPTSYSAKADATAEDKLASLRAVAMGRDGPGHATEKTAALPPPPSLPAELEAGSPLN